jgi:hypothetical protein
MYWYPLLDSMIGKGLPINPWQYPRRPTQSGTVPHFVKQFQKKWNCSKFSGSPDSEAEQLYEKVEQVLKAGHSSTKCGTATHILVLK